MGTRRNSLEMLPFLLLVTIVLVASIAVHAATETYSLRVKVLTAETYAINGGTPVPKDCDLQNFSAYCNESKNPSSESTMLVQDNQGKSYRLTCTADSRWSKCAALPVGMTFEGRKEKRGIILFYRDPKGKEVKQLYVVSAVSTSPSPSSAAVVVPPPPPAAARPQKSITTTLDPPVAITQAAAPVKVLCSFNSTPGGADITIDGSYVGNTPSEISLSAGRHVVQIAMVGFGAWKRELTVSPESALNVTANLQKSQP